MEGLPYYLDERKWNKLPDEDILLHISEDEKLKPTDSEWQLFFHWLLEVVGEEQGKVEELKLKKPSTRKITAKLCFFLHFTRLGIPLPHLTPSLFNTKKGWLKNNRRAWKHAAYVNVPKVKGSFDWWCLPSDPTSLSAYSAYKVCHLFQTSPIDEEEQKTRGEMTNEIIVRSQRRSDLITAGQSLVSSIATKLPLISTEENWEVLQITASSVSSLVSMYDELVGCVDALRRDCGDERLKFTVDQLRERDDLHLTHLSDLIDKFDALQSSLLLHFPALLSSLTPPDNADHPPSHSSDGDTHNDTSSPDLDNTNYTNNDNDLSNNNNNITIDHNENNDNMGENNGENEKQINQREGENEMNEEGEDLLQRDIEVKDVLVDQPPLFPDNPVPNTVFDIGNEKANGEKTNDGEDNVIPSSPPSAESKTEVRVLHTPACYYDDDDDDDYSDGDEEGEEERDIVEEYERRRATIKDVINNAGAGEAWTILEVYLGLERMVIQRLVLIARQLNLDEDFFADILAANYDISAERNVRVRRITQKSRAPRQPSMITQNLIASGLL